MAKRTKLSAKTKVLNAFKRAANQGATTDQIEKRTRLSHQTASARVNELYNDGLLELTGQVRPTRYGRPAFVYYYVDAPSYPVSFGNL
jgi:predicted transcriptional regulator